MSADESSDEENVDEELLIRNFEAEAQLLVQDLLPEKSKDSYLKAYDNFISWKNTNRAGFEESVFMVYFAELAKTLKPPSLWSIWSKLKATLNIYGHVNLDSYLSLKKYLSNKHKGYKPKQSNSLTLEQIKTFVNDADDNTFLAMKAMVIVGFFGCLRCQEILNLKLSNFEDAKTCYIITITETKTYITRNFVISGEYYEIVKQYRILRPKDMKDTDRFFVTYHKGKCTHQFVGKNKICEIPKIIAQFLKLPDIETYTGHCYRRSSATALSHAGANLTTLKFHGGWKSDRVAQSYVDHSKFHRQKVFNMISGTKIDPKNHFTNHPPISNIFVSSNELRNQVSTSNESVCTLVNSSNLQHTSQNNSRNISLTDSTPGNPSNEIGSNVDNLCIPEENQYLVKTAAPSIINKNQNFIGEMSCKPSTSKQNGTDSTLNNELASLSDGCDDILADVILEDVDYNKENKRESNSNFLPQKTQKKEKQHCNIEIGEPYPKKVKSSPKCESPKTLFQNCEIHTINVNNNYYYPCEEK